MYKISKYNYVVEKDSRYIIFNGVTCCCIILTENEYEDYISQTDSNFVEKFVRMGFYVDEKIDETKKFIEKSQNYGLNNKLLYIRLYSTTCCNATCSYCYEGDMKPMNMTIEMADRVYNFIEKKYNGHEEICIEWFGGEPLLNVSVISYLSEKIDVFANNVGCKFWARMITNGSLIHLIDHNNFKKWKLTHIQITLDGLKRQYEQIKNYKDATTYETIIKNIDYALKQNLKVTIRINYSEDTIYNCLQLIKELNAFFPEKRNIRIYGKRIMLKNKNNSANASTNLDISIFDTCVEYGFVKKIERTINCRLIGCVAKNKDAYMIMSDGNIGKCSQAMADYNYIGHIDTGIDKLKERVWIATRLEEICLNCRLLPICNGGCLYEKINEKEYCMTSDRMLKHKLLKILENN